MEILLIRKNGIHYFIILDIISQLEKSLVGIIELESEHSTYFARNDFK